MSIRTGRVQNQNCVCQGGANSCFLAAPDDASIVPKLNVSRGGPTHEDLRGGRGKAEKPGTEEDARRAEVKLVRIDANQISIWRRVSIARRGRRWYARALTVKAAPAARALTSKVLGLACMASRSCDEDKSQIRDDQPWPQSLLLCTVKLCSLFFFRHHSTKRGRRGTCAGTWPRIADGEARCT